ncbi:TMEM175 family protein [Pseudonocardia sp. T1-2H]|uniref:TMEM175 family protein n=1 Tax=Pseudonocardia sp. T1-2H TaxID=3128899 RepID=UPI003101257C
MADLLREHAADILAFLLSFTVIARLWLAQHSIVSVLVRQNPLVVGLLLAWTLTIVFLPFPTTLVAGTSNDGLAKLLYIGTMTMSSALLALLPRVIGRDRSLRDTDAGPDVLPTAGTTSAGLEQAPVVDPRLHRAVIRPARRPAGPR